MRNTIPTIWREAYCYDGAPTNSATKQLEVVERAERLGLLDILPYEPMPLTRVWPAIACVHDPAYVEAVRTGEPLALAESQAFAWSPALATGVASIFDGQSAAAAFALVQAERHPDVWSAVLHPVSGAHHAGYERGAGFCTFNFLVGPLLSLRLLARRPLILDLDAHLGDGTLDLLTHHKIAEAGDRIAVFDVSESMMEFSPRKSRHPMQVLHGVSNVGQYRAALDTLPAFLDKTQPGLVFFQAGMDPHYGDPVGGIKGVTRSFLQWRDRYVIDLLRTRNIPTVVNLAGGYSELAPRLHVDTIVALSDALNGALVSASTGV